MPTKTALLFADEKLGVGLGHISRCTALKEELEEQGFVAKILDSCFLDSYFLDSCNLKILYDLIVIDSYVLPLDSYVLATKYAKKCLFFDDTLRLNYPQGIIINSANMESKKYKEKYPNHTLFLGNGYTLTQRAFKHQSLKKLNPIIKRVLITLGGDDILVLNTPISYALSNTFPSLQIHCITKDSLQLPKCVKAYSQLNAQEMVQCIRSMDLCICACGQSLREILYCGVPVIALEVADNQSANLESFQTCTLNLPKAYAMPKEQILQSVIELVKKSQNLSLRLKHRRIAKALLTYKNLWKGAF
ncbi:hypothetical protein [Helicobacter winghamensis]|uniref:hypothetical protein n=1 Tax=Helicobacter winghamensis TaxID=157268 RepID=UPI0001A286E5|nr:hypothetical protein [Helicobacter winghamensis]EEO26661.1 hypothetical protein HWAG_01453 [Helicobacter winghamensis ATCC BAA-430]PKT79022.1 hypothetical protein BCM34_04145 [Helicobacter winghamensis]PKT79149.1 hypothetical protein BCM35_03685 [Helicobacter winghamensis]